MLTPHRSGFSDRGMTLRMILLASAFVVVMGGCSRQLATASPVMGDSGGTAVETTSVDADGVVHVPAVSRAYIGVEPAAVGDGQATIHAPGRVTFRDGA